MKSLPLPKEYNYVGVFLTFACRLRCSYCLNRFNDAHIRKRPLMRAKDWIHALNRIEVRDDLPLSLQGGEPTCHPEFYEIVQGVNRPMDLLTNLDFDIDEFIDEVHPDKFKRDAPYASIRVSYHPEMMSIHKTLIKVVRLLEKGYQVGVWMVDHPAWLLERESMRLACDKADIDFRLKEFLGVHEGNLYGTYKYKDSIVPYSNGRKVLCRTTELLIAPDGVVHRCHSDLYHGRRGVGSVLDDTLDVSHRWRLCDKFGTCNPCDVKVKTNRHQVFGHTSVEIKEMG